MTRSFKREFPPVDWVPQPKHILPDGNTLLIHTHAHRRTSRKLDGLTPGESDVAPLCFTSKLLITDQVRGPAHHLHQSSADLRCVNEWRGVLDTGDWAWIFFFLCVYSASGEQQSDCISIQIYPTLMGGAQMLGSLPPSAVHEDRRAAVILQWEGSGRHLPHQMRRANEKQASSHGGIFHRDHRGGCILWLFGYFTDNEVHSQMLWEHLASLQ